MDSLSLGGVRMEFGNMESSKIKINDETIARINELLAQLSEKPKRLSREDLKKIFAQPGFYLAVVFIEEKLVGMASIYFRETLIRKTGIIEDVVVDKKYRKKGFGRKLTVLLLEEAKKRKVNCVELTSNPKRKEAIVMYESMGFKKRETNCYRLDLSV